MTKHSFFFFFFNVAHLFIYCESINYNELNFESDNCKENEYFDITALKCEVCPANKTTYKEIDPYSCVCKPGFVHFWHPETRETSCIQCPEKYTVSSDGYHCIQCFESQAYNEKTHSCDSCPSHMISIDHYFNGSSRGIMQCIGCQENFVPDNYQTRCIPCYGEHCNCLNSFHIVSQDICLSNMNLSNAGIQEGKRSYTVQFRNEYKKSELFHKYFRISSYGCYFLKNTSSCQLLANLCVLLFHSFEFSNACGQYWYRVPFGEALNLPEYLPFLYYDKNIPSYEIMQNSSFNLKLSLKNGNFNNNFNLTVAKYSLFGELLFYGLADNTFNICPDIVTRLKKISVGDYFQSKCRLPTNLLHQYSTEFYDIFLHYYEDGQLKKLPVPILNLNYEFSGSKVNMKAESNWQFTQRIFLIDNISGQNISKSQYYPEKYHIRYIESLEFMIQLQRKSMDGSIYLPYLKVKYGEATVQELKSQQYIEIDIKLTYFTDSKSSFEIISVTMGIASTFVTVLALIKTWSTSKRCGKLNVDITTAIHLVCIACGYFANCFYYIIFFICCVWVFIFKFQSVLWIFLPTESQEFVMKQYIIAAFSLKIVQIIYIIFNQITIDLFFVDWEQPKTYHANYSLNYKVESKKNEASVSIWRTYFIANEWNELQTYRKVSLPLTLFLLLFCLKVLGYEDIGKATILNSIIDEGIQLSFITRFALSIFLFLFVSYLQELFMVVIYERYIENKLQMFVDLCSMANISVLIFMLPLYGYYIHGKSVYGEADLSMRSLFDNMKREEDDLFPKRGLEPTSECQTFEVRATSKFRISYDSILGTFREDHYPKGSKRNEQRGGERCVEAHEQMKKFLSIFLQHGLKELDYTVREKLFLENVLDLEFQEPTEKSFFFRDYRHSFDKVLFYGKEGIFLSFEMMVFTFVDMFATDFILASFITFLIHKFIYILRYEGGKRNMLYKTLVDDRFLI